MLFLNHRQGQRACALDMSAMPNPESCVRLHGSVEPAPHALYSNAQLLNTLLADYYHELF